MSDKRESGSDGGVDVKLYPEAIVTDTKLFSKSGKKTFEETDSLDSFYKPIDSYEGRHRYDPQFQWEPAEEKRVVRKVCIFLVLEILIAERLQIDYRICTWVCLMFFALQLDRGNISQALTDNFLPDLGMNTNDYNTG